LLEQLGDSKAPAEADDRTDFRARVPVRHVELRRGEDFDAVVLGIPVGTLGGLCGEFAEASQRWRRMIDALRTTRTQGLQLWFNCAKDEMTPQNLALTPRSTGANPFATWADMSHVARRETWPEGAPRHVAYLCGPMA
jgi:hypothetical protein